MPITQMGASLRVIGASSRLWLRDKRCRAFLAVLALAVLTVSRAAGAANSWSIPSSGKWEGGTNWSLGLAPDRTQTVLITNAGSDLIVSGLPGKQVIIDATTSSDTNVMTVTNLVLSGAGSNVVNWLALTNANTNVPLHILSKVTLATGSQLTVDASSLQVDGQFAVGAQTAGFSASFPALLSVKSGSARVGTLVVGPASNTVGTLTLSGGALQVTNLGIGNNGATNLGSGTGAATIGDNAFLSVSTLSLGSTIGGLGNLQISNGSVTVRSNVTLVSASLAATSSITILSGSFSATNGAIQVGPTGAGSFTIAGGTNIIRRLLLGGSGTNSRGEFRISGGTLKVLGIGTGPGDGIVVNSGDFFDGYTDGTSTSITIDDGHQATMEGGSHYFGAMYVGHSDHSTGTYIQSGGSMAILSGLIVGDNCPPGSQDPNTQGAIGTVQLNGGWLFVTNATHTAVLDVRNGSLTLQPGAFLVVDNLVVTNGCGRFINNGGIIFPGNAVYTENLLLNPGAEDGVLGPWGPEAQGGPTVVQNGYVHADSWSFFWGPNQSSYAPLTQAVDLNAFPDIKLDDLDSGKLLANVSFWELTVPGPAGPYYDDAKLTLDFVDSSGSVVLGSISSPELESSDYWTNYSSQYAVPVGTRRLNYTLGFVHNTYHDQVYVDDNLVFLSAAPSPPLTVQRAGDNVVLSWPAWAANFALQFSTDLATPNSWQPVPAEPIAAAGRFFVTNSIQAGARYYRLRGKL